MPFVNKRFRLQKSTFMNKEKYYYMTGWKGALPAMEYAPTHKSKEKSLFLKTWVYKDVRHQVMLLNCCYYISSLQPIVRVMA